MARRKTPKPSQQPAGPPADMVGETGGNRLSARLHSIALLIVLAIVAVRPTLSEEWTYENQGDAALPEPHAPAFATAATSLGLTLLTAVAATIHIVGRVCAGGLVWRPVAGLVGIVLLAGGTVWSVTSAVNERTAAITGAVWLGQLGLFVLLVQLLRRNWQVRWLLLTVLATLVLTAGKAVWQVTVELPETRFVYESRKVAGQFPEAFARAVAGDPPAEQAAADADNPVPDDRRTRWFEERLNKGSATGYVSHANVFGSLLMMGLVVAVGFAADNLRRTSGAARRATLFVSAAAIGLLALGLVLSRSRGAAAASAVALAAYFVAARWGGLLVRHKWKVFGALGATAAAGIVAVVLIGVQTGRLPGRTLDFRWQYWAATFEMLRDHWVPDKGEWVQQTGLWLRGVGPGNFGAWYPRVMPAGALEEVKSPHCVPLQALAEFGLAGGVGLVLWAALLALRVVRTAGDEAGQAASPQAPQTGAAAPTAAAAPTPADSPDSAKRSAALARVLKAGTAGAAALAALWIWVGKPDLLLLVALVALPAALWLGLFAALHGDHTEPTPLSDAPMPRTEIAVACALAGAAMHGLIDFNLFWPAGATVIFALAAALVAMQTLRRPEAEQERRLPLPPRVAAAALLLYLLLALIGVFVPAGAALIFVSAVVPTAMHNRGRRPADRLPLAPVLGAMAAFVLIPLPALFAGKVVLPVSRSESLLTDARMRIENPRTWEDLPRGEQELNELAGRDSDKFSIWEGARDPAPWEALAAYHSRRWNRARQEIEGLLAGRLSKPGVNVDHIVDDYRGRARVIIEELIRSLNAIARLRLRDAGTRAVLAEAHRMAAEAYIDGWAGPRRPVATPLDERGPKDDKPNEMPLVGRVFGDLQARLLMLYSAEQHRRQAVLAAQDALSLKPNDSRLALTLARIAEGKRPRDKVAALYRRVLDLDDAVRKDAPLEALPATVRREAEAAVQRLGNGP